MKTSTHSFRLIASSLFAAVTVVATLGMTVGSASAAKPRPTPTPRPAPTSVPAPTAVPTAVSVPVPATMVIATNYPDVIQVNISPASSATFSGDAEIISGPSGAEGPIIVYVASNGSVSFSRLVENSDYVFRYRNKYGAIVSPWVQFSFHTPTIASIRPATPQNLRVTARTATTVTITWDAVPALAKSYQYVLYGVNVNNNLVPSVTIPLAGLGSNNRIFTLQAVGDIPYCGGPYCDPPDQYLLSVPATLVVPN